MDRFVVQNGAVVDAERAQISVYDRAFLYGDSIFETMRTYGGEIFAVDAHLVRLETSAARIGLALPWNRSFLRMELESAARRGPRCDRYLRLMITRGSGPLGLDPDTAVEPSRLIFVEPLKPPSARLYRDGGVAVSMQLGAVPSALGAKGGYYVPAILALRGAKARGACETLWIDSAGRVLEGSTSNVFAIVAGEVVTPPADSGILAGITRKFVLEVAEALRLAVDERHILLGDACAADELFITSSLREILPIIRIDDRTIGRGIPGDTTRQIHRAFREKAGAHPPDPWTTVTSQSDAEALHPTEE